MTRRAILVALDTNRREDALHLAARLDPTCCRLKIGKELYTREGRTLVETLQQQGHDIFLDLKFHDIPHTAAAAVRVAADMGVWMVNVHAGGGRKMLEAAANALTHYCTPPLLIAVTVLTSMNDADLRETGIDEPLAAHVARLTALAADSGLDGVVCSAQEAAAVKAVHGSAFLTVTPGIRPAWAAADDQSRIMTPEAAIAGGSDYLVIGRPITRATDPAAALAAIRHSITPE